MLYALNNAFRKMKTVFGFKSLIIRVVDDIMFANTKHKMFMAIFSLHSKYFDVVEFDHLFLDTLDTIFIIDSYDSHCSYLGIAAIITADNRISENELRNILLNWIYNEPYFRNLILIETPQAHVETLPILTEATMI